MDPQKERLRKKLKDKKNKRNGVPPELGNVDEETLFTMLNQVNKMLKENPNMVKKVSKCVNSIFENKDLMSSLVNEIETNVQEPEPEPEPELGSQILEISSAVVATQADSN